MRVLELYSGIGGMHLALQTSGVNGEVIASVDINQTANAVYKHNFPGTLLLNRNIQSLTAEFINNLNVDTVLMSPPCQPFTRNGLKEDLKDTRTISFIHFLNILPGINLQNILIENVKGFETSEMRNILIRTLKQCEFTFEEFILSPCQFGIPNTRHRYYCIAKKQPRFLVKNKLIITKTEAFTIIDIIEKDANLEKYYIPDEILHKRIMYMDICNKDSKRSCCFTKSYGRYVTGTGSVYTPKTKDDLDNIFEEIKIYEENLNEYLICLKKLQLRFFTPREICRLMCFPEHFVFPDNLSYRKICMLIGNSINVKVVAELIKLLNDYVALFFTFINNRN